MCEKRGRLNAPVWQVEAGGKLIARVAGECEFFGAHWALVCALVTVKWRVVPCGATLVSAFHAEVTNVTECAYGGIAAVTRGMPVAILGEIPQEQRDQAVRRLPGIRPVGQADWITVDGSYAAQMAEKAQLMAARRDAVYQMRPAAQAAAEELSQVVCALLRDRADFVVADDVVRCPDGREVHLHHAAPLLVLGQILQEDLCIHLPIDGVHHLMGALLCFPASWTLAQKIGKPLTAIHSPVPEYDEALAARVQRLFDGVQVGQPIWRANFLLELRVLSSPVLISPLPRTRAVVFAIHTTVAQRAV